MLAEYGVEIISGLARGIDGMGQRGALLGKGKTFAVLAAVPSEQAQSVLETNFSKPTVMLIGNEGNGLSQAAIDACDACVTIPMMGRAESLNAASSAAILMWEMMRGRIDMQLEESV